MSDHFDDNFRSFGGIDNEAIDGVASTAELKGSKESAESKRQIAKCLRESIIGTYEKFTGPYGDRPIVYADWTASGKCVSKVEEYIAENVIPLYGNTHTTTSITGHQTTCFRHEARQIVAEAVNAKVTGRAAVDVVIFTGNGTTAAINKLILSMGFNTPLPSGYDEIYRPIVFTSSYEHHSNLLSWRESAADVVTVQYHPNTGVCLDDLSRLLLLYSARIVKVGAFSAASNVTGILTAANAVSALMHRAGGFVFFDYATAAPYVKMDMNPVVLGDDAPYVYKDAIIFSGHKFIGGPGCPGVLVVKRAVLPAQNSLPTEPGGGTVFYVTEEHHRYLSNREEREEGGTPDILGDVKLGLVVSLKQSLGASWIEQEELRISRHAQSRLTSCRFITLLGRTGGWIGAEGVEAMHHLPIFPFLVRRGHRFLHHNFVCALLNDLFGIQSRGGCQCAGPFSQHILGLSGEDNKKIELALLDKHEVLRPGYSRFSLSYWMSSEEIEFILNAVIFIAEHGWKFLHLYRFNHKTGEWAHTTRLTRFPERKWLTHFDITAAATMQPPPAAAVASASASLTVQGSGKRTEVQRALANWGADTSEALLASIEKMAVEEVAKIQNALHPKGKKNKKTPAPPVTGDGSDVALTAFEDVRWFVLASDVDFSSEISVGEEGGGGGGMALKGPVQPPQGPCISTPIVAEDVSASEHIEPLNRLVSCLGSPSEQKSEQEVKVKTKVLPSAASSGSNTGSLYAQQRSQKLCIRSGGEGRHLPRYLEALSSAASSVPMPPPLPADKAPKVPQNSAYASHKEVKTVPMAISTAIEAAVTSIERVEPSSSSELLPSKAAPSVSSSSSSSTTASTSGKLQSGSGVTYAPSTATSSAPDPLITVKTVVPPKKIMKLVGQAVKEWNMIEEGDRLLLGLSGGKDSLALLHILLALQALGVPYHYLSEPIVALAKTKLQGDSLCAFCSRFKRGLLYSCCRTNGYNKLVLAQHLDDLVESFLMSALHNGQVRTMKANYTIEAGDVRVIRPLVYVREKSTRDFSQEVHLPVINENCPACFEEPKERDRMKKLLVQEEAMIPALFFNLKRALLPLLDDSTYVTMQAVAAAAESRGRSGKDRLPSKKQDQVRNMEENKRKRILESGGKGPGPGLFGQNSNLTNGNTTTSITPGDDPLSDNVLGTKVDDITCSPDAKKTKFLPENEVTDKMQDGDDSDEEEHVDLSICTSSYCPPCYELA